MSNTKILILSVSAGAGHVRAAEALRRCAEAQFADVTALHLDVMDYVPKGFRKIYTDGYISLVNNYPTLWGMLYQRSSAANPEGSTHKLRRAMERLNTRALLKAIEEFGADAIICTHFLPAELLMHEIRRKRLHIPVWVQVTDFDLHRMWVIPHVTGFLAANDEIAFRMRGHGIRPEAIHVTGIPIMPAFSQRLGRSECAHEFGLDPQRPIFLLMGGGAGMGQLEKVADRLLTLSADFQLLALAGKNAVALKALQALQTQHPTRLFAQGFTDKVERMMACADLVITKPGGLTSSECLAIGVPMIVHSPIPGQEERNADYLLEQGAALKAVDTVALEYRIGQLLSAPEKLATMRMRAQALGRPHAAQHVMGIVLAGLKGHDS